MNNALRAQAEAIIIGWIDAGSTEEQIDDMYHEWHDCIVNEEADGGASREMAQCSMTVEEWEEFLDDKKRETALCAAEIELWTGNEGLAEALIGVGRIENDPFDNVHLLIDHSDDCPF